jgi:hypothetical protein
LRSILEGYVRVTADTLEVEGGTPRISDQFPALDRKRGNAWNHNLQDAVDMASLAVATVNELFNIQHIVVTRPVKACVHVVTHEDSQACSVAKFVLAFRRGARRFVSDLRPER